MDKLSNIAKEQQTVEQMIRLYCRHKEKNETLCEPCRELLDYARTRLSRCPYGEKKKTCRLCPVHCYKPEMRKKITEVMRFSGPRMIWYHPGSAIRHVWKELFV